MIKKKIYEIIEIGSATNNLSKIYDSVMVVIIFASLVPLLFKEPNKYTITIEYVCVSIFIIDYILRLLTANLKLKKGILSYLIYPFTFWGLIDLLTLLPSIRIITNTFKSFNAFRGLRALRILKVLKYSQNFQVILNVMQKNKQILMSLLAFAVGYVLFTGLFMFNVEPETFDSYFESVYWATTALTTVGYGDIYPISAIGRAVSMVSSFFGIAIIALPSGVITAGFINEVKKD